MSFSVPTSIIKSSYYTCYIHLRSLRKNIQLLLKPTMRPSSVPFLSYPCALSLQIPITPSFYFNFILNFNLILKIIYSYFNTTSYF